MINFLISVVVSFPAIDILISFASAVSSCDCLHAFLGLFTSFCFFFHTSWDWCISSNKWFLHLALTSFDYTHTYKQLFASFFIPFHFFDLAIRAPVSVGCHALFSCSTAFCTLFSPWSVLWLLLLWSGSNTSWFYVLITEGNYWWKHGNLPSGGKTKLHCDYYLDWEYAIDRNEYDILMI